jgi:hypothetical protein
MASSSKNNFETIQNMLYSKVTVNPGEMLELPANDKQIEVIQKDLSSRAVDFIERQKRLIEKEVERLKIKNSISNSTLFDEVLHDKNKRSEKQKCSEILSFTLRKLSPTELTKFGLDTTKTYYIIDGIQCDSVAAIVGFKVGDIIIGMYNTDGNVKELLDYNDEEALYNSNGNDIYDDRTILYINIRVLRHVKTTLDFDLSYLNITPIFERISSNVLYHGKRFVLPYYGNQNNTVIQLGSLFLKKYISGLTDYKQVGGMQPVQPSLAQGLGIRNPLASAASSSAPARASAAIDRSVASSQGVGPQLLSGATNGSVARSAAAESQLLSATTQGNAAPAGAAISNTVAQLSAPVQSNIAQSLGNADPLASATFNPSLAQGLGNTNAQASAASSSAPARASAAIDRSVASSQGVGPQLLSGATNGSVASGAAVGPQLLSAATNDSVAPAGAAVSNTVAPTSAAVQSNVARGVQNSNVLTSAALNTNVALGLGNTNAQASAASSSAPPRASGAIDGSVASAQSVRPQLLSAAIQSNVASAAAVAPQALRAARQRNMAAAGAVVSGTVAPTSAAVQSNVARGVQNSNALTSAALNTSIARGLGNTNAQASAALSSAPPRASGATNGSVARAAAAVPLQLHSVIQQNIGLSRAVENNSITFPDGILPTGQHPLKKQRILLINLYLNQIFNKILLNTNKSIPLLYKNSTNNTQESYSLPNYPQIDYKNDKQIISKVNSLLDPNKSISSEPCSYQGGNNFRIKKQKTIKKKIRNIKNKKSLKNNIKIKMNKKIKKYVKKGIKNNIKKQKQEKQQKQQQENKYRIKKLLESKIHEKINKLKLNKTKNWSQNKSYHHSRQKYTRKNY